ncbi:hypothetical protein L3Q82_026472 [Xyrichtys novacula]|uniref:Platelet-activating factor receptor n=1 Tax=Xyrichtys novacula TaxID=13765 RepID=A0AAV1GK10_XYRNO|nr:hypothetical protein L3Q82_026472 [Xyrichtys novacula]
MQALLGTAKLVSPMGNDLDFVDSEFRYSLFPVVYGIIFILGLFANLYVLIVLRGLREEDAMGEIRIYMTNLTIADLLFVCALPPWIGYYVRHGNWIYSDFTCRLTGSLFFINTYCSILFLGAISLNRYWAVTRPLDAASSDRRCRGIAVSVFIWVLTTAMAVPSLASPGTNTDGNITRCFEGYQNQTDSEKKAVAATHFAIIGMFIVIFFLVVVCNILIAKALLSGSPPSLEYKSAKTISGKSNSHFCFLSKRPKGAKQKALQMLLAVVGVFVLCFLPHHVIQGLWTLAVLQIKEGWGHVDWDKKTCQALNDAHQITLILMNLNCILDPVVYYFSTKKFKGFIMSHIKKLKQINFVGSSLTEMFNSTTQQVPDTGTSGVGPQAAVSSTFLDSEFRYILFPVAYGIIFILGLLANIYVLFVLRCLRGAKSMGEIRIYMTNLTIADLLFVCALPPWIGYYVRHGNWIYSDFTCRLTGSLFFINTYCSILFLGAISLNRYWAVTRPLDAASSDHRCRGITVSVFIWLLTTAMAVPSLASPGTNTDGNITRCFEGYQNQTDSEKKKVAATHFAIIGMFIVIFFLVVVCNFLIAQALLSQNLPPSEFRSATMTSRKSNGASSSFRKPRGVKRRALQMLLAVVGVFVFCFLPHHVIQGLWTLAVLQITEGWGHVDWGQKTRQVLNDAHQITYFLMGLNCILDPVVYCFATRKFRRFIMSHIKRIGKGEGCSHTVTSQLSMDSRNQSHRLQNEIQQPEMD